ncbi:MAG TPA: hypothetical protein VG944_09310 [Fimbriimonas sp.]|nr:hypothetical protein [Fimbriimonas sp.]
MGIGFTKMFRRLGVTVLAAAAGSVSALAQSNNDTLNPTISVQSYIAVNTSATRPSGTGSPITQGASTLAIASEQSGNFGSGTGISRNVANNSSNTGDGDNCATYYVWCNVNAHLALSTNTMTFHVANHTGNTASGNIGWSSTGNPGSSGLNTSFTANKVASPIVLYARFYKSSIFGNSNQWDGDWSNSSSFTITISAP